MEAVEYWKDGSFKTSKGSSQTKRLSGCVKERPVSGAQTCKRGRWQKLN
jgi:hypothetical protein